MFLVDVGHLVESEVVVMDAELRLHFQVHWVHICVMHDVCDEVRRPSVLVYRRSQVRGRCVYTQVFEVKTWDGK